MLGFTLLLTAAVLFVAGCFTPVDPCKSLCGDAGAAVGGGSGGGGSGGGASGGGTGGGGPLTGAASISIEGLAWPASASLEGPNGFTRALTASVMVPALEPGNYTLRAANVLEPDAVAARVFVPDQVAQSLTVVAGETASASVKYEADPTTGLVYLVTHIDPLPSVGALRAHVRVFQASDLKSGGLKTPLHVAELPDCRAGNMFLDHRDRIWIGCGNRQFKSEWRRFSRAQLGSELKPTPEATLSISTPRRVLVDRDGHVWSWENTYAWVGKHSDTDFDVIGDAGFPVADAGFTRGSHRPRFFLKDGSLFGWDYLSKTFGRYDAALLTSNGDVTVAAVATPDAVIGTDAEFVRFDETALYARWAQRLFEFPLDALRDGGLVAPTKEFGAPDGVEALVTFDASLRFWSYSNQKNAYVVVVPGQLATDSGTALSPSWEVSWPPADIGEKYGMLLFYPPPRGQRYAGY